MSVITGGPKEKREYLKKELAKYRAMAEDAANEEDDVNATRLNKLVDKLEAEIQGLNKLLQNE